MDVDSGIISKMTTNVGRVSEKQDVDAAIGSDGLTAVNPGPGPTESGHIHPAADIGGAAVLLNVGERIGLLPHLSEGAVVSAKFLAQTLDLPESHDLEIPEQTGRDSAIAAVSYDLDLGASAPVSRYLVLAYDDIYSIEYFERRLRPYWRRRGATRSPRGRTGT